MRAFNVSQPRKTDHYNYSSGGAKREKRLKEGKKRFKTNNNQKSNKKHISNDDFFSLFLSLFVFQIDHLCRSTTRLEFGSIPASEVAAAIPRKKERRKKQQQKECE